ncbi:hypothetical protein EAH75_04425 [Rhodanobacter glycinis]|nr:hypothetical protein EAH75_04425 [Rhodanobacter glycinis]
MDVYFHGVREGADWRGQVIGNDGSVKARTSHLLPTQERAIEAVKVQWDALQKQLREVAA